ncbi:DUF5408 family protein [Helicobacter winghamensis]|uniref:Uncharacterized protein n=1 Tax=Helicobacter winghamensis TaxID=157268 RepID=A0A2N3PKR4_9HELI|nr:DUF5408 family protein [Helicobacter winghamensis]EEO26028.1 hypothetical protein HWAG_00820 [Helicobacter winghamensis ATCC BAA-430]PKT78848.1 hypothetical protein BCM34_07670 [Helicobacter winghamensis]PKT78879.1 hypothetical protein BCM32_07035 [Helicobacter winghamensis]PKT78987.1 hypothetical protein BCM35_07240 [Helicobacter winghamensis]PKT82207.1 hypothetical protein BCM31_02035 [Helicobacter winghamensis]
MQEIEQAQNTAKRAVKIALIACVITILFATLSLWVLLNQITATANLTKMQKVQEARLEKLESIQK